MRGKSPFRFLEPYLFSGLLDDPTLMIRVKPEAQNILIDCGNIYHLAKRNLKSVSTVLITHAHMDHFMGFDALVRNALISPKIINVFGPPGIADKIEYKLNAFDWNLIEKHYCSFRVHETRPETMYICLFDGAEGFARRRCGSQERKDKTIFSNNYLKVEADLCDHKIPVLIFKITEMSGFEVDEQKIASLGLEKGPWLQELKTYYRSRESKPNKRIRIKTSSGKEKVVLTESDRLYRDIQKDIKPLSIGYFTDIGFTKENRNKVLGLMKNVTLLVGECRHLSKEIEKARRSHHLCVEDINVLLRDLRPEYYLPMHLSNTYLQSSDELFSELKPPENCKILKPPKRLTPQPLLTGKIPLLFDEHNNANFNN